MAGPDLSYNDTITLWRVTGRDDFGDPTFAEPETAAARWSDRAVQFRDTEGRETVSRSIVAIEALDFAAGDFIALGTFSDAAPVQAASEIRQVSRVRSIDGTWDRRRAFL